MKRNILLSIYISTIDINVSYIYISIYIYIHYILAIEYKLHFVRVYRHTLQYLDKRDEETSERTLPRACKMSHCKVFRRRCFAGKIESPRTGAIPIAAGCDLTPIPCRQRLQHRGTLHCRLCIALKSSPGIYSPLAEYAIRSAAMAALETTCPDIRAARVFD